MTIFGEIAEDSPESKDAQPLSVGVERSRRGECRIRIGSNANAKAGELVDYLPLQVIGAQVFQLLEGGPVARREFMDWGVFHVEPQFRHCWRRFRRALAQRNIALRKPGLSESELEPWSRQMAEAAGEINDMRRNWHQIFVPIFERIAAKLLEDDVEEIRLDYQCGWDVDIPLLEDYRRHWRRDQARGYTQRGAHRADLSVSVGGRQALNVLSRGPTEAAFRFDASGAGDAAAGAGRQALPVSWSTICPRNWIENAGNVSARPWSRPGIRFSSVA